MDPENGFNFTMWSKRSFLTEKTINVLRAEEVDTIPVLVLLEESDLRELNLPMGQRKLLINGINYLKEMSCNSTSNSSSNISYNSIYNDIIYNSCYSNNNNINPSNSINYHNRSNNSTHHNSYNNDVNNNQDNSNYQPNNNNVSRCSSKLSETYMTNSRQQHQQRRGRRMSRMMPIIPDNIPGFKSTDDEESERDVCTEEEEEEEEEDADEGEHEREEIIEGRRHDDEEQERLENDAEEEDDEEENEREEEEGEEEEDDERSEAFVSEELNERIREDNILLVSRQRHCSVTTRGNSRVGGTNEMLEDIYEFNATEDEISDNELLSEDHITLQKVFEVKDDNDEPDVSMATTSSGCCEVDITRTSSDSDATIGDESQDSRSNKERRGKAVRKRRESRALPILPHGKYIGPEERNENNERSDRTDRNQMQDKNGRMKHTVTLKLDFKSVPDDNGSFHGPLAKSELRHPQQNVLRTDGMQANVG